jgi:hypothetical protein
VNRLWMGNLYGHGKERLFVFQGTLGLIWESISYASGICEYTLHEDGY